MDETRIISAPKLLLHLEGMLVLVAACIGYGHFGFHWWKFAALFLVPDVAMVGYFAGTRIGAMLYNLAHTYVTIGVFGLIGYLLHWPYALPISLIWLAHVGFDRLLGYGLKYPAAFKDTHLGRV